MKRSKPLLRTAMKPRGEIKPKTCAWCRGDFFPVRPMQKVCGPVCGQHVGRQKTAAAAAKAQREDRKATRARLIELKPRQYWLGKAEQAVNRYVRARDFHKGCISCHLPASWDGQWHASHFRSVGAASAVRFHLWNIHKACWICNKQHSGNIGEYTPRLVALIGQARVDWLKAQNHVADYSREYLERLAKVFNKKARRQEARNAKS